MKRLAGLIAASIVAVSVTPALSSIPALAALPPTDASADPTNSSTDSKKLSPQPPLVNEQLVTASLAPNGLPKSTELINRIVATNMPTQNVVSTTSTTNVRYLDRAGKPVVSGNTVQYPVGGPGQTTAATQADFSKPLPVALHAEYATSGDGEKGINPDSVAGRSGDMRVRYTVTNTSVEKQKITYTDAGGNERTVEQPVFSPFVGTMIATLAQDVALKDAGTAVVSTNNEGRTTLLWNLVLYPPLGNYQQDLIFKVNSASLQIPAVKLEVVPVENGQDPAVGFSAKLLSDSVAGNTKLADGLTELDSSAAKLANGASELTKAQAEASKATGQAYQGSKGIATGSKALASGLVDLSNGLDQLAGSSGLPVAVKATGQLADAVNAIASAVGAASNGPIPTPPPLPTNVTLVQASRAAQKSAQLLADGAGSAAVDANAARTKIDTAYVQLCGPLPPTPPPPTPGCSDLLTARTKAASAELKSGTVAVGVALLDTALLAKITAGLIEVSTALKSLSTAKPGVYEGLVELQAKLAIAADATAKLATGANGASTGSQDLATGTSELAIGLGKLTDGSRKILAGDEGLAKGANELQTKGTSKILDGVITSSEDPAMASAYLTAASKRATESSPFPPPKGAASRVAFVYSMDPPPPTATANPAAIGIGLVALAALAVVVVRRIRRPVPTV